MDIIMCVCRENTRSYRVLSVHPMVFGKSLQKANLSQFSGHFAGATEELRRQAIGLCLQAEARRTLASLCPLPSLGALSARVRPPCDPVAALFATGRRAARLPPSGRVSPGDRREVGDGRGGDRSRHFVEEMAEFTEDVCRRSGVGRRWCRANRTC